MTIELKKVVHERLRRRGKLRRISQDELKEKCTPENGWIAVQGLVYDITPHIKQHPGWKCGCATSELMAILRCLGTDCTDEFLEIHSAQAMQRLQLFMIGELVDSRGGSTRAAGSESVDMSSIAPKCCVGLLYFSQSRYDRQKPPVCAGFAKRLKPTDEASHLPTDSIPGGEFKYACLGYSAWNEEALKQAAQRRSSQGDAVQLPYCEGLEIVSAAAVNGRPELLTEGPGVRGPPRGPSSSQGGESTSGADAGQKPGRTFVPGGFGQGEMPSEMDWDKFRTRFERVSKKIIDKMGQNASFMATTVKKSWEQVIRELSGKERPPG